MRVLIAIKSCERDAVNGCNVAQRVTWLPCVRGADYRFFVGQGHVTLQDDEVRVAAPDDYMALPYKTREIVRWSLAADYDHVFLCDTDTYVRPMRLLASGFDRGDLVGCVNGPPSVPGAVEGKYAWVSGGNGYWLSRRAMSAVASHDPNHWAEDCWVAQVVQLQRLTVIDDQRYGNGEITTHFCSTGHKRLFEVTWMHEQHRLLGGTP